MPDQDFTPEPNMKPFLPPVLFLYAGSGLARWHPHLCLPAKGCNFWNLEQLYFSLRENLTPGLNRQISVNESIHTVPFTGSSLCPERVCLCPHWLPLSLVLGPVMPPWLAGIQSWAMSPWLSTYTSPTFHKRTKTLHWWIPLDLHHWVRKELPGGIRDSGFPSFGKAVHSLVRSKCKWEYDLKPFLNSWRHCRIHC